MIIIKKAYNWFKKYRDWMVEAIMLLLFIYILEEYGWKGTKYWLAALLVYTIFVIWKMWPFIKQQRQLIEIMLFGKTLEKENWEKGEYAKFKKFKWK